MRKILIVILVLGLISVVLATNHVPPTLNNFEQFYGSVSGISATGFKVRATIGTTQFETPIAANGQYGYSPTFKVNGQNGQTITFFVVNAAGAVTPVGTAPYQNQAITLLNFQYAPGGNAQCGNNVREAPEVCDGTNLVSQTCATQVGTGSTGTLRCPANCMAFNTSQNFDTSQCTASTGGSAQCGNNIRESTESCDGTDLAGQTCASNVGTGSTGALNCTSSCTFNTTLCTASTGTCWLCNDWGRCRNNLETRTCARADCTEAGALRSDPADERLCGNISRTSSTPSTCTMNWECSAWSLCRSAQQTRICFRADNCDTLLAQRQITSVTSALKPREEQTCQEAVTTTPQQVCDSGMKRCLGPQLQLCSADGMQWATLQTCPGSCDSTSLTCRTEQTAPPSPQQPSSSSLWMYLLAGSVVLILVIVSISMALLIKKKYAPAKDYIRESRNSGIDDEQIREKLVEEGWDEKAVGKLFK